MFSLQAGQTSVLLPSNFVALLHVHSRMHLVRSVFKYHCLGTSLFHFIVYAVVCVSLGLLQAGLLCAEKIFHSDNYLYHIYNTDAVADATL